MLLESPLSVNPTKSKTKKGKFILNLNNYKGADNHRLNSTKKEYKKVMAEQISRLPHLKAVEVTYVLYPKTRRLTDIGNVLSIHEKYFMDALVELGKLPDDNYLYQYKGHTRMGFIDPDNPRVEIIIKEVGPKKLKDFEYESNSR